MPCWRITSIPLLSAKGKELERGPLGGASPGSHLLTNMFVTLKLLTELFTIYLGCLLVVEHPFSFERTRHKHRRYAVQKLTLALAVAALFALPMSAFSQDVEIGPGGVQINPGYGYQHGYYHRHRGYGQCEELRAACMHKEEMGEQGQGNCRRYRQMCGRG